MCLCIYLVLSAVMAELVFHSSVRDHGLMISLSQQASENCKETLGECVYVVSDVSWAGTCSSSKSTIHLFGVSIPPPLAATQFLLSNLISILEWTASICDHEIERPLHLSSTCFLDEFVFKLPDLTPHERLWGVRNSRSVFRNFPGSSGALNHVTPR